MLQVKMNETKSVYLLISKLCANVIKEQREHIEGYDLNCAKRTAFEILLKNNFHEIPENEKLVQELQFSSFELSLAKRSSESKKLNSIAEKIREQPENESIYWLLLHLKQNIEPGFDKLKHQDCRRFFKITSNFRVVNKNNVYLPSASQKFIRLPSPGITVRDDCSFFSGILDSYLGNQKIHLMPPDRIPKRIEQKKVIKTLTRKVKLVKSWENLEAVEEIIKSFSSESSSSIHNQLSTLKLKKRVETNIVPFEKLLNDVKLLAIGVESESFKRAPNDPLTFQMPSNLSCEDVSDVGDFIGTFIETGTCFKRLKTFTSKNPFNQSYIFEGFIFKAFSDKVIKFLNHYRDVVYSQEVETLVEFSCNTHNIRKILIHITKFLKIHPSSTSRSMLPSGSDFLGLLYNEYMTMHDNEVKYFFIECLKYCCQMYFNNFHKWLFQGLVDDPHKELFIYFVGHYRPNTKYFFDKAYLIRKQSVPGFLQGFAENILLCGKYTMLLKSYNQVHPLFMLQKPLLKVCLTSEELYELKSQCKEYSKLARAACGPSISIERIMLERKQLYSDKHKLADIASVKNFKQWKFEQEERRVELAMKRELQNQGLCQELRRIEEEKIVKRMKKIQSVRDYLDESEEYMSSKIQQENLELQERIERYQKLNKQMDEDMKIRENFVGNLKVALKTKEDNLNANEIIPLAKANSFVEAMSNENSEIDEMNNVVNKPILTEAQRNKVKIMSHEYNLETQQSIIEQNGNLSASLTVVQPRLLKDIKTFCSDFDIGEKLKGPPKISVDGCQNMTDLQRNRLKVLQHEFNLETSFSIKTSKDMSLNLLQVDTAPLHLESPMSVTSDHFSNEPENQEQENKSVDREAMVKSQEGISEYEDDDSFEMLKSFEEAVEKNSSLFMGINLKSFTSQSSTLSIHEHIKTTDTMALSRFLQMSLMIPVNSYMKILNNETLKMFVRDLDILLHFKSLRNYFLMMNGEFGSSICRHLFTRLETGVRPSELLNYQSLHLILNQALSQSKTNSENTKNLSFIVQNVPEKFELHSPSVLNMLTMSYQLDWPLSLILNPETMEQYQAIFNFLLKLKRISWVLEECFQMLKDLHKRNCKDALQSKRFRNVQLIRHKMTHFVQCLENHVTRNVLQISWIAFVNCLKSAHSIHCIYRKHTNYLKRILFLCLLNKKSFEFQKTIEESFKVILKFYKHLKAKDWMEFDDDFAYLKYQKIKVDGEDFERLIKYIMYLGKKIIRHGYQKEIYDLLYLIDINGFYSQA